MTDNSAYRATGTQSSNVCAGAPSTEDKPASAAADSGTAKERRSGSDGGGDAAANFDMTSNTAYSTTSYN